MAQDEAVKKLQQYIRILQENGILVSKAFLFGSYLRKEATEQSDIDVMIVSPHFDIRNDSLAGKTWSLTRKVDSRIEPYLVGLNSFLKDDFSPILEVVKKEGLEISVN